MQLYYVDVNYKLNTDIANITCKIEFADIPVVLLSCSLTRVLGSDTVTYKLLL